MVTGLLMSMALYCRTCKSDHYKTWVMRGAGDENLGKEFRDGPRAHQYSQIQISSTSTTRSCNALLVRRRINLLQNRYRRITSTLCKTLSHDNAMHSTVFQPPAGGLGGLLDGDDDLGGAGAVAEAEGAVVVLVAPGPESPLP